MAQLSSSKCSVCSDEIGKLYCYECEQVLCHRCKNYHDKFTSNKEHTVNTDLNRSFRPKPVCADHRKEYTHYCKSCECLTCGECNISVHNGHVFCGLTKVVDRFRKQTTDMASDLKTKVKVIENLMDTIKSDKLSQIKCCSKEFLKETTLTATAFNQTIDSVKTYYETAASDYESLESEKLETVLKSLKCLHNNYSDIYLKIENALLEKHGITFLFEQKSIQKESENLDEIPDIPESKRMSDFNIPFFTDHVIEKIQEKFSIRIITETKEEVKKLKEKVEESNRKLHEEKTKYEDKIKQLTDRLIEEQLRSKQEKLSQQKQHEFKIKELTDRFLEAQSTIKLLQDVLDEGAIWEVDPQDIPCPECRPQTNL